MKLKVRQGRRQHQAPRLLRWLLPLVLVLTIPAFYLELAATEVPLHHLGRSLYAIVFVAFALAEGYAIRHTRRWPIYFRRHWLALLVTLGAAANLVGSYGNWSPAEWVLRMLFVGLVLVYFLHALRVLFSPDSVYYIIALGGATLALAGAGFYWLEPTVHSYADGLWLAFESGATVGYGDLIPTTPAARIFAAFMVLLGYAVMSLVTATIAALFVGKAEKRRQAEMHADIKQLRAEVTQLRAELQAGQWPPATPARQVRDE
jgi:voltage-gated potassium channel